MSTFSPSAAQGYEPHHQRQWVGSAGAALLTVGLHAGLFTLLLTGWTPALEMPRATQVMHTELISLPPPAVPEVLAEPPVEPVVEPPPVEPQVDTAAEQLRLEQAELAFKRAEQEREAEQKKLQRERLERRREEQRQEQAREQERLAEQARVEEARRQAQATQRAEAAERARQAAAAEAASSFVHRLRPPRASVTSRASSMVGPCPYRMYGTPFTTASNDASCRPRIHFR